MHIFPRYPQILTKYDLYCVLESYASGTQFPDKESWKKLVKSRVFSKVVADWQDRTITPEFTRFRSIQVYYNLNRVWAFSSRTPKVRKYCKSLIQMIASLTRINVVCKNCNIAVSNITDHCICECPSVESYRRNLCISIRSHFGQNVYDYLRNLSRDQLVNVLLHAEDSGLETVLDCHSDKFHGVTASKLHFLWVKYISVN